VYVKLFVINVKYSIAEQMVAVEKDVKKKFYIQHCSELIARLPGINPLNPELNPICCLLALLAHHSLHVSRISVKSLTLRQTNVIYIYIYI